MAIRMTSKGDATVSLLSGDKTRKYDSNGKPSALSFQRKSSDDNEINNLGNNNYDLNCKEQCCNRNRQSPADYRSSLHFIRYLCLLPFTFIMSLVLLGVKEYEYCPSCYSSQYRCDDTPGYSIPTFYCFNDRIKICCPWFDNETCKTKHFVDIIGINNPEDINKNMNFWVDKHAITILICLLTFIPVIGILSTVPCFDKCCMCDLRWLVHRYFIRLIWIINTILISIPLFIYMSNNNNLCSNYNSAFGIVNSQKWYPWNTINYISILSLSINLSILIPWIILKILKKCGTCKKFNEVCDICYE